MTSNVREGLSEASRGVPAHSRRQVETPEHSATQALRQVAFVATSPVAYTVEPAPVGLGLPEPLPLLDSGQQLLEGLGAVADRPPKQRELVVAVLHVRSNVRYERPTVDATIDEVKRATDLVGLAVVECPERTVGTAKPRRQTAVQVDQTQATAGEQVAANQRCSEDGDQIR